MSNIKILVIIIILICVYFFFFYDTQPNESKKYILTFKYDNRLNRYMIHGLWLDNVTHCDGEYVIPDDKNNFIKNNWYDRNVNAKENTLFKYEYIKHGTCFGVTTNEYADLVKDLYDKHYDKYIKNNKSNTKEIWLYMD